jgi:hypothetical protein
MEERKSVKQYQDSMIRSEKAKSHMKVKPRGISGQ